MVVERRGWGEEEEGGGKERLSVLQVQALGKLSNPKWSVF